MAGHPRSASLLCGRSSPPVFRHVVGDACLDRASGPDLQGVVHSALRCEYRVQACCAPPTVGRGERAGHCVRWSGVTCAGHPRSACNYIRHRSCPGYTTSACSLWDRSSCWLHHGRGACWNVCGCVHDCMARVFPGCVSRIQIPQWIMEFEFESEEAPEFG